ncbi:MAG: DUF937 domain-containing protein [Lachnospiraceae bacterium]|nr:DUF937 domain-containing protein [Lachnospiraceae bacterium]
MDLLGMLMGTMSSGSSLQALSGKTGLSEKKLQKLLVAAIPILLKFLTKNAGSAQGAQSLLGALAGHKQTRSMAEQITDADEEDGAKIIKHILGDQADSVVANLASENEMDSAQVNKVLSSMAPGLMSGLSAATSSAAKVDLSDGLDLSDVMGMFGGDGSSAESAGGLLGGLLGGGSSGASGGLLGGLLGGGASSGGLLGGLFGGGAKEEDSAGTQANGMELLGILSSLMK